MKIEYPEKINAVPNTEGINPMMGMMVDMLPIYFEADVDNTIENVKKQYQSIKNSYLMDAHARIEQCLFRLYEAKYLILPHCDVDLMGFAFDDVYHGFVVERVAECYDAERGEQEYELAIEAVRGKDYETAGAHFKGAALCGHAAAQYNYGVSVANGEVGEADPLEGAFWYFIAAKGGNAKAMINLAIAYRTGAGVFRNLPMMLYWYGKAALIPFPYGVYNLGLCLQNEEYFTGNAIIGRRLKEASEELEDESARAFAVNIATQVLNILKDKTFNI